MTRPSDDPPAAIPASHKLGDPHRHTPACSDRPTTLAQVDNDIFLGRLRATWAYETPRDYHGAGEEAYASAHDTGTHDCSHDAVVASIEE
jgi:hypothetical protein